MGRIRIKVCCIASIAEAELAIAHGADAIGFVGVEPPNPRSIDNDLIRDIAARVPPGVGTFLLTSHTSGSDIADQVEYCGTTTVQIAQHIDVDEYKKIIQRIPTVRRVQVLHVENRSVLDLVGKYEPFVHAFLLDSGRPSSPAMELGGTGRTHDWTISAELVALTQKPVFLAGGLNPSNVREAITSVGPYGLDLCTGVRINKKLDAELLREFTAKVWR